VPEVSVHIILSIVVKKAIILVHLHRVSQNLTSLITPINLGDLQVFYTLKYYNLPLNLNIILNLIDYSNLLNYLFYFCFDGKCCKSNIDEYLLIIGDYLLRIDGLRRFYWAE